MRAHRRRSLIVLLSLFLCNCGGQASRAEPTPEAAKEFLKLRGYKYDEKSFLEAAAAGDLLAVKAFLVAVLTRTRRMIARGIRL